MTNINQPIHPGIPITATFGVENNPNTTQASSINPSTIPSIQSNLPPSTLSIPPEPTS